MKEHLRNLKPLRTHFNRLALKTLALLTTGLVLLPAIPTQAQFIAFNDHYQGFRSSTNATFYILDAGTNSGPLKDITTGAWLPVILTITNNGCSGAGSAGTSFASGPAYDTFQGYVDFVSPTINIPNVYAACGHIITGLDPNCRYSFKGTANRGESYYTNRWTLFELLGADSLRNAHSAGCLTNDLAKGVVLASNQVALCTGFNTYAGDIFDWEDVQPGNDGQVVIISRKYTGIVPNGTNDALWNVYGLGGLRVEETFRPIVITNQPQGIIFLPGKVFAFSVGVRGTGPLFYQWRKDGTNITGATNRSYTISSTTISDSGAYSVIISNSGSAVVSGDAILTIGFYPPVISIPPHSVTQAVSAPFTFNVVVTGAMPISYQWFKDSVAIPGATNSTYAIFSAKRSDVGAYLVRISNEVDVITSEPVMLTLTNAPVSILTDPADQALIQGGTAGFTVVVSGTEPAFQWFKSDVSIPNATNATYSISNVQLSDTGWYSVQITNLLNSVFSRRALLSVTPSPITLLSNAQVWRFNYLGNDLGNTWVDPSFDDGLWPAGPGPLGFPSNEPMPPGVTLRTVIPQLSPCSGYPMTHYFRARFTLPNFESGLFLNVSSLIDDGAVFYLNGREIQRIRMPAGSINFQTRANSSVEVASQGWDIFSISGDSLIAGTNIIAIEVHQSSSIVSDMIMGSIWTLGYSPPCVLSITNEPANQTNAEGQTVIFKAGVQGGAGVFQWFKINAGSPVPIPRATSSCLKISTPVLGVDDGEYFVTITNPVSQVVSKLATLTLTSTLPVITSHPLSQTICEGDELVMQICAYGSPPLSCQWRLNGMDVPAATNQLYGIPSPTINDTGVYSAVVSNAYGFTESLTATLQVNPKQPLITRQPADFVGSIGGSAYFTVEALGCDLCYQWQFNGSNITRQLYDPRVLVLGNLSSSQSGNYSVIVSNRFGFLTSAVAQLTFTSLSIPEALNWNDWTNSGTSWFVQGNESHDGVAALQAGTLGPGQLSILQTTLNGPAKIGFWFKLRTDSLPIGVFTIDNIRQFNVRGEIDWHREVFYLGPGPHVLEWEFFSNSSTQPAYAWLDEVSYTTNVSPSLLSPLPSVVTAPGDKVVFRALAEGMPPLHYQWQLNGFNIPGANQPALTIENAQSPDAGAYTLILSNDYGAITPTATLALTNAAPLFHPQKSYVIAVPGGDAAIRASAFGPGPLSYQWRFQGLPISGQTNDILLLHELGAARAGLYSVIVSNAFGAAVGPDVQLIVNPVTHVIHLSMDGLGGKYLATALQMEPQRYPYFLKTVNEGSTTLNARCDYDMSVTVPNHICMITGRPVGQPAGKPLSVPHGYTLDQSPAGATIHNSGNPAVPYKSSVFDVVHDYGLTAAFMAGKTSLSICADSYNAVNGAPDLIPPDNGRKKIDYVLYTSTRDIVDQVLASLTGKAPFNYYFLHFRDMDDFGHGGNWGSHIYYAGLEMLDTQLGRILAAIEINSNPAVAFGTVLILTADHGGEGINHDQNAIETVYTIPLFVWGPGFPGNTDLYTLFANRADPGTDYLDYNALWQPLRNGDTGNLALSILGLPPIPGSYMQPLFPNTPWLAIFRQDGIPTLEWSSAATGFTLETSDQIGPQAHWTSITTGIIRTETRYTYPIPSDPTPHFYRLHK